jgi:hypothetical protein
MTDPLLLIQFADNHDQPRAARLSDGVVFPCATAVSVLDLATTAIARNQSLSDMAEQTRWLDGQNIDAFLADHRLLPPVTHPDPVHLHATGTGLTHLGSADTRNRMHGAATDETDSMRMFRQGLEGGRPDGPAPGAQPEWFYKGNGHGVVSPGARITAPSFALDAGEEPELAGIYLIAPDGTPVRLGFTLANEFSDHVLEKQNYLLLAHSKLRPFSIGPALRVGNPPDNIRGTSRILRNGQCIWEKPFLTGEANMSHSLANLEHHHFKYDIFRQPGNVHVHMFGTATLSFADAVRCEDGDVFEIVADGFGPALRNPLLFRPAAPTARVAVRNL